MLEKARQGIARVEAVSISDKHTFSKENKDSIHLVAGLGVEGDAHFGATVKHRSRVAKDPNQPNLRQVHLLHKELFAELKEDFTIKPGQMGENITTSGIELLMLPRDTELHIGETAIVKVTGLRNPCAQIDHFQPGLLKAVLGKDAAGNVVRKAGFMGIVLQSGVVKGGDAIRVVLPKGPFKKLERV